ncbi:hypothetical protein GW17_00025107 [Ensete ventricosum]|nr:hypothetical protein GW17_00025107 [Ensete ventricosum]
MEVLRRSERNGAAPVVSMVEVLAGETCLAAQRSLFWRRGRIFRFNFGFPYRGGLISTVPPRSSTMLAGSVRLFVVMSYRVGEILVSWVGPPLVLSFSPPTRKGYSRDALKKDVGKILGVCCRGFATWAPTLPAKTVAQSLPEVEKVQAEAVAKKGAEALSKRPTKESLHPRKKVNVSNRHMSQHGEEGSKSHASKGKE